MTNMTSRKSPRTAPFLVKLQTICSTIPPEIGFWRTDDQFEVTDSKAFFAFLEGFFNGTPRTFFRQLSYFRFSRSEIPPNGFMFTNKDFRKDDFQSLCHIKRNTQSNNNSTSSDADDERFSRMEVEMQDLQNQVTELKDEITRLKRKLSEVTMLNHRAIEPFSKVPERIELTESINPIDPCLWDVTFDALGVETPPNGKRVRADAFFDE